MDHSYFLDVVKKALLLVFELSAPAIIAATVVGIVISVLQAVTQIQEQTLPFAIKLLTIGVVIVLTMNTIGAAVYSFTISGYDAIPFL